MSPESATMTTLLEAVRAFSPRLLGADVTITDLHHDSRSVGPGEGFVAIPGSKFDGHQFTDQAVERGAAALIVEHGVEGSVPQLIVDNTRAATPHLAASVHGHPSRELAVAGVTGTNGKTTVTHMLEAIGKAAGRNAAVVGTVGARIAGRSIAVARTTPEATDLQRLLRQMVDAGVGMVALEVSSHAMALNRVDAVDFDVVAFTNLSQDHLDFHGDMEAYFREKARLFERDRAEQAVIWVDDPAGERLAAMTDLDVTSVGFSQGRDLWARVTEATVEHSRAMVSASGKRFELMVPLPGRFNVANALVAIGSAAALGIDEETAAAAIGEMPPIPGRFERVETGLGFVVVVDYAHTPEAIASIVAEAATVASGRVITVVGAGGERDHAKRPAMGRAAATADVAIITSDNPRSEEPWGIVADVLQGAAAGEGHVVAEPNRSAAIQLAVDTARDGDIVLLLGKGHEQGQEIGGEVIPFDDRRVAAAAVSSRVDKGGTG